MSLLIGALGSLIASIVWVVSLRALRPRIEIAPLISQGFNSRGERIFRIKVLNRGRFESVNVRAELSSLKARPAPNGKIVWTKTELTLVRDFLPVIPRFDRSDDDAPYAYRFTTYVDLAQVLSDGDKQIRFRVYAEHPISRVARSKTLQYGDAMIRDGNYFQGHRLDIAERGEAQ